MDCPTVERAAGQPVYHSTVGVIDIINQPNSPAGRDAGSWRKTVSTRKRLGRGGDGVRQRESLVSFSPVA